MSHPIFLFTQNHPVIGRGLHIIYDLVPDTAFVLLALAGLSWLMPKRYFDKLEGMLWARISIVVFFAVFGFAAIIINAINRESQAFNQEQQTNLMGTVMKSVTNIQEDLKPKATNLSENERRQHLLSSLRDEYALLQNPIDPEIVNGTKMPPASWMNQRLREMGEKWAVTDEPSRISQVVQQAPAGTEYAKVVFSLTRINSPQDVISVQIDPMDDNIAKFSIWSMVAGDASAEDLHIWIRECKECTWESPLPPGFATSSETPFDRTIGFSELVPNVSTERWDFRVRFPTFPHYNSVKIACYYACRNCPVVDWNKPQVLWITRSFNGLSELQFPSISYTPAQGQK
jgi:hypothetical protein